MYGSVLILSRGVGFLYVRYTVQVRVPYYVPVCPLFDCFVHTVVYVHRSRIKDTLPPLYPPRVLKLSQLTHTFILSEDCLCLYLPYVGTLL